LELEDIMLKRIAVVVAILALPALLAVTISAAVDENAKSVNLTVHEWGTFTSVAGPDGKAAQWLPLAGPGDLPCFVEQFQNRLFKDIGPVAANIQKNPIDYNKARTQLLGPIRMETPVLYFYSPKPEKVNVRIAFPKGFITEWYPKATLNQTPVRAGVLTQSGNTGATIAWKNVEVLPRDARVSIPQGPKASHYYAARETEANPLRVNDQTEKFLFYRGVGGFPVPVNVTVTDSGKIRIRYLAGKPHAILFESRGGKLGYTVVDTSQSEAVLDTPALTGDFQSLRERNLKRHWSARVCLRRKPPRWSRRGEIHGSKRGRDCFTSCRPQWSTRFFLSRSSLSLRTSSEYLSAGWKFSLRPRSKQWKRQSTPATRR